MTFVWDEMGKYPVRDREIVIQEDIHKECFVLLKKLGKKAEATRVLGVCVPSLRPRMCYDMIEIIDSALAVFKLLELTQ